MRQVPAPQKKVDWQSASEAQLALHALPTQANPFVHAFAAGITHEPLAHVPCSTTFVPEHVCVPHTLIGNTHAPLAMPPQWPAHVPVPGHAG
jgi:hypothetical protein